AELVAHYAVVAKDELLASTAPAVTSEGFGYDPDRGELWFAGEAAEAVWLGLEARRRALAREVEELRMNPAAVAPGGNPPLIRAGERLVQALAGAAQVGLRFEAALRARVDAGGSRTGDAAAALRELAAREAELRRTAAEAAERAAAVDVELARLEAEQSAARRRLEEAGAEPADGDDREALSERLAPRARPPRAARGGHPPPEGRGAGGRAGGRRA